MYHIYCAHMWELSETRHHSAQQIQCIMDAHTLTQPMAQNYRLLLRTLIAHARLDHVVGVLRMLLAVLDLSL